MATIPENVKEMIERSKTLYCATAGKDGTPNINYLGIKKVIDDETLMISDHFFLKTLANLQENPQVAIGVFDGKQAYQIKGTVRYVNEGPEFEEQAAWVKGVFEQMGLPLQSKGIGFVTVTGVYDSNAGPAAGQLMA